MSTSMRSIVPDSFGFTATRLRGASVPEISSEDSITPADAFTTDTSTIVASGAVVSGAAYAVVDEEPHAARNREELRTIAKPTRANWELFRLMTTHSGRNRGSRDSFFRALARYERGCNAGLQAGDGGVEHVARERVVVFAGGEA